MTTGRARYRHWMRTATLVGGLLAGLGPWMSQAEAQWATNGPNSYTTGYVGIGTSTPNYPLDVKVAPNGHLFVRSPAMFGMGQDGVVLQSGTDTDSAMKSLTIESGMVLLNPATGGFVGVRTVSPRYPLDVKVDTNRHLFVRAPAGFGLNVGGILLHSGNDNDSAHQPITIESSGLFLNAATQTNVGIGTTTPQAKLHVAGDVRVDGNIGAKYQDVAEWVRSGAAVASGTVVVIDGKATDRVLPAAQAYDTRVAGVISPEPGILLGVPGDDKVKVAHSGRVKVKVDAQYGSIAVGDLLVTSPTPGYAMRSKPVTIGDTAIHRPGTLLGKALEPLAEGQGEVLVLLILQ